jgi:hypothetical protein
VVREAERTVYHTQWRIWEELALEQLAWTAGLARAPLLPGFGGDPDRHLERGTYRPCAAGRAARPWRVLGGRGGEAGAAVRAV